MNLKDFFKRKQDASAVMKPKSFTINGHEWVDLGLSVKWATCNVGASSPNESGSYFAWGEIVPKSEYTWENYKFRISGKYYNAVFDKYQTDTFCKKGETIHDSEFSWTKSGADMNTKSGKQGVIDGKRFLDACDDAARYNWGGTWRMPTREEFTELVENCSWEETLQGGQRGYMVTSIVNGNSIFLPLSGYWSDDRLEGSGIGYLWSSCLFTEEPFKAIGLEFAYSPTFESDMIGWTSMARCYGLPVRPVSD